MLVYALVVEMYELPPGDVPPAVAEHGSVAVDKADNIPEDGHPVEKRDGLASILH